MKEFTPTLSTLIPLDVIGRYEVSAWGNVRETCQHLFYGTTLPPLPPAAPPGGPVDREIGLTGVNTIPSGLPAVIWHAGHWTMVVMYEHMPHTMACATVQDIVRSCQRHMLLPPQHRGTESCLWMVAKRRSTCRGIPAPSPLTHRTVKVGLGPFESAAVTHKYP